MFDSSKLKSQTKKRRKTIELSKPPTSGILLGYIDSQAAHNWEKDMGTINQATTPQLAPCGLSLTAPWSLSAVVCGLFPASHRRQHPWIRPGRWDSWFLPSDCLTYICMYGWMDVCIYLSIYLCIYVSMYLCMYVYIYMCVCVCIYIYMYIDVYRCICVYIYRMYVYIYICMYVYIYIICMCIYISYVIYIYIASVCIYICIYTVCMYI